MSNCESEYRQIIYLKFFSFTCKSLSSSTWAHCFVYYHLSPEKRGQHCPCSNLLSGSCRGVKSLLSLLFSKLNNPNLLSFFSCILFSTTFSSFIALLWMHWAIPYPSSEDGTYLTTVLKVCSYLGWVQKSDHFPTSAGRTVSDADQNGTGLGPLGTLLACVFVFLQVVFCVHINSTGNIRLYLLTWRRKFWSMMALKSQVTFFPPVTEFSLIHWEI